MEICYRSGSILFPLHILAIAGFILMCFFKSVEILRYRLLPQSQQNLKRREKRAVKNNEDVPVADNSQSQQLNEPAVEPVQQSVESTQLEGSALGGLREYTEVSLRYSTFQFGSRFRMNVDWLGDVFTAKMLYTHEHVAIRRLKPILFLANKEFYQQLSLLSQLNHPNLAKLIGYSNDQGSRALVYEYPHGGFLENYLRGNKMCLDWRTRMKIAVGVARAIEFLHNVINPPIVHCYIQPANVWLDEDLTPKLSAAGVMRMFPTHNPDRKGCPMEATGSYAGYHDFFFTKTVGVTLATDIYGLGILLLELMTARKGIFDREDGKLQRLSDWVQPYFKDGNLAEMVDPRIEGKIDENELSEVCAIAQACLEKQPGSRPQIADVVRRLNHLVG